MPYYMVKITEDDGDIKQPIVANAEDENDAHDVVKYLASNTDTITVREIQEDVALAYFGAIPPSHALVCRNWIWEKDGDGVQITI